MAGKIYNPKYPGLYYFDTFTFTTLGTSGHRGPDPTKRYLDAPWNEGDFSIVDGQQQWTVPASGTYRIEAAGAYGAAPGRVVSGEVNLSEGQVVSLLVGQQPTPLTVNVADNVTVGGGGGTFVTSKGKPLIVASGGDGGVYSTGYLRSELVTTPNYQIKVSMSADGNIYAAIEVNLITLQFALTIYRYSVGIWTPEFTAPAGFTGVALSGNGKTVAVPTSNSITVYEYIDQIWQNPRYITNIDWNSVSTTIQISYDGNTIVAFTEDIAFNWHLYVCTKNQDLTWNTEELSAPAIDTFSVYESYSCAISGDGTRIFAAADIDSFPRSANVWSYSRTNDTWSLPEFYTSFGTTVRVENISASYDGQIIAVYAGNLQTDPREGYLYVYENGTLTKNLTFPWNVYQYPAGAAQISYDGSLVLVILITGKILVTPSTQITIFDDASGFPLPTGCIDSTASRIVSPYYDVANPITYFFEAGGSGQPGSFLPSGSGSGISGAGYLTDGQVSNPYFGFMKPQAYVDGGFGNTYLYGHKGEGGFGGGQSPLNNQTDLTSVTGYKQVRPTISLVSPGLDGMAISEDANTLLVSFVTGSGTNYANVYTYDGTSWVSTNLYTTSGYGLSVAMSGDGSVWLINSDVWRNGSFETQLQSFTPLGIGFDYTDISRDGNTVAIIYGQAGGFGNFDKTVRLIVYSYSGSWTSSTLFSENPGTEFAGYVCAMSADGNTIAMSYSVAAYGFVNVYRRVDDTWSGPEQILYETHDSINTIVLNVNSDGSIITLAGDGGYYSQYSNGVLSKVDFNTRSVAFSQTDPKLYAWVDTTTVFVPSISLEVNVQVDPAGIDVLRMGTNVLAMTKILTPHAIVFLDMYDPTTTCTANTSVPHGYPHDYKVQITGTQYFNGTWDIVTSTANTFTFQAFGGPNVSSGYVSGITTGISGGGGYTGSPGDGVSGATCYADASVKNFTDLGATSNSAGYVTVSLIDPVPINTFYSWDKVWTSDIWTDPFPSQWSSSSYGNGTYVVIADSALPIMYSTDGVNWSIYTSGVSYGVSIRCISYGSGIFVAAGTDFVLQSPDGINWTQSASPFPYVRAITYAEDRFVVIDTDYSYYSFDGIAWNSVSLPSTGFYDSLTYGNGLVVASGTYFSIPITIYSNDKGLTWNTGTITSPSNANSAYVAYGNGKFVIATNQSEVFYSIDAETWTTVNVPAIFSTIAIVFGNGLFVTANYQQDYVLSSSDGITWQKSQTGVIQNSWSTIVYGNGVFTIFSYYSSPTLIISPDALNWLDPVTIKSTNLIKTLWNFVQYGNGTYITGSQQGYIQYSFDGTTWYRDVQGIPTPNTIDIYVDNIWWSSCMWSDILGKFIVTSTNDQSPVDAPVIIYSSDGRTWSSDGITGVTPGRWFGSVWGNDKIVIVGATAPYVMYSKDGFTWSSDVTGVAATGYDDVTYGNGKFVAVSYRDGITMSSTDGINWSQSSVGDSTVNLTSVTFGNGKFVTISPNGSTNKVFYSSDGINWSSNTTGVPLTSSYYYISFGAGLFMTTCLNGTPVVIYSSDGINWFSDTTGGIPTFWISVTYGNGKFIAVTGDTNVTVSSMSTNLILSF